jgi:hypothetical protein
VRSRPATEDRKLKIATEMIASVRAQMACRNRWFEAHAERAWRCNAGACEGAEPPIAGEVNVAAALPQA